MEDTKYKMSNILKFFIILTCILIILSLTSIITTMITAGITPQTTEGKADYNYTSSKIYAGSCFTTICLPIFTIPLIIICIIMYVIGKRKWKEEINKEPLRRKEELAHMEKKIQLMKQEQIEKIKDEERRRQEEEHNRQKEERKRQQEEKKRQDEEKRRQESEKRKRVLEEQQAHNYETAFRYDDAILIYEKLELWNDAGRCRKLLREQKLEEIQAHQPKIDIGHLDKSVKISDSAINRTNIGQEKD